MGELDRSCRLSLRMTNHRPRLSPPDAGVKRVGARPPRELCTTVDVTPELPLEAVVRVWTVLDAPLLRDVLASHLGQDRIAGNGRWPRVRRRPNMEVVWTPTSASGCGCAGWIAS